MCFLNYAYLQLIPTTVFHINNVNNSSSSDHYELRRPKHETKSRVTDKNSSSWSVLFSSWSFRYCYNFLNKVWNLYDKQHLLGKRGGKSDLRRIFIFIMIIIITIIIDYIFSEIELIKQCSLGTILIFCMALFNLKSFSFNIFFITGIDDLLYLSVTILLIHSFSSYHALFFCEENFFLKFSILKHFLANFRHNFDLLSFNDSISIIVLLKHVKT